MYRLGYDKEHHFNHQRKEAHRRSGASHAAHSLPTRSDWSHGIAHRLRDLFVRRLHGTPGRKSIKSCTMFAVQADGRQVLTIEGLAADGKLDPMQEAFWNEHGLQCGFCTPGMIMTAKQIVERTPNPTEQ